MIRVWRQRVRFWTEGTATDGHSVNMKVWRACNAPDNSQAHCAARWRSVPFQQINGAHARARARVSARARRGSCLPPRRRCCLPVAAVLCCSPLCLPLFLSLFLSLPRTQRLSSPSSSISPLTSVSSASSSSSSPWMPQPCTRSLQHPGKWSQQLRTQRRGARLCSDLTQRIDLRERERGGEQEHKGNEEKPVADSGQGLISVSCRLPFPWRGRTETCFLQLFEAVIGNRPLMTSGSCTLDRFGRLNKKNPQP